MTPTIPADARQYPIGPWDGRGAYPPDQRLDLLQQLRTLSAQYRRETGSLPDEDLVHPYRPGSWPVRQLVHHVLSAGLLPPRSPARPVAGADLGHQGLHARHHLAHIGLALDRA